MPKPQQQIREKSTSYLLGRRGSFTSPDAGIIGAAVIANWSWTLMRDTAGILLDVVPDAHLQDQIRKAIEEDGDQVTDLHLWRLGPGHLGVMLSVTANAPHPPALYRAKLNRFHSLSHVTVEVQPHRTAFETAPD